MLKGSDNYTWQICIWSTLILEFRFHEMQSSEQKFCGCSLKLQDGDFVWTVDPNNKTPMRILNVKNHSILKKHHIKTMEEPRGLYSSVWKLWQWNCQALDCWLNIHEKFIKFVTHWISQYEMCGNEIIRLRITSWWDTITNLIWFVTHRV